MIKTKTKEICIVMNKTVTFIGAGNMASAMIGGIVNSKLIKPDNIIVTRRNKEKLKQLEKQYQVKATTDNVEAASKADILFLAVKPNMYTSIIEEIKHCIKQNCVVVTIAAGQSIEMVESQFGKPIHLIRTMPNTPALVGEGMSALCKNKLVTEEEIEIVKALFESFGRCEIVQESLIEAVIGVSGSSPAYVYMFIEAMADAAVMNGMKREQAYEFAAQAVYGSAKMVLETGVHPGKLKDMVCSPAGTTIEAVAELEKRGFRSAVIEAIRVCINKSKQMTDNKK